MIGIRTKLILFMSTLVIIIGTLSCLFFLIHVKRQQEEGIIKLGTSLVMLLTQDNEVKHALMSTQPAFLDAPIKRIRALDREEEIGYLRISDIQSVLVEEKAPWIPIDMKEIPARKSFQNQDVLLTDCMLACSRASPEQLAELQALQVRLGRNTRIITGLMIISVLGMSTFRYFG